MNVHAPFNFVPLSDEVYLPEWYDQISHDVPFSDGLSGKIRLTIEAQSDIFIRNGQKKDADDNSFSHIAGRYFIPATSIKGEVRNLIDIMGFGKMSLDPRAKFAQREWNNKKLYSIKNPVIQSNIRCGYLRKNGTKYEIEDCGIPYRISHKEIDEWFGNGEKMALNFSKDRSKIDLNKELILNNKTFDPKTAVYKYHHFQNQQLEDLSFSRVGDGRKVYLDDRGEIKGDIVFTGQPDLWDWPRCPRGGKFYEFVFPAGDQDQHTLLSLTEEEFEHYEFIYKDSPDWRYHKPRLRSKSKGVPVFFRSTNNKVIDFGLAFLYKLPYDHSPMDLLPASHKDGQRPDLSECIFGFTNIGGKSLKGRVYFSNAYSTNAVPGEEVSLVLGSPKASYYPIYIKQDYEVSGKIRTYNDGELSGWKRYHVRDGLWSGGTATEKAASKMIPLKSGAIFRSDIVFHNLRPIELGALLSALTFHDNPDSCSHLLGQAKSYGYGRCRYSIELEGVEHAPTYYMARFEHALNQKVGSWHQTDVIRELFTIASRPVACDTHRYMTMSTNWRENEFLAAKDPGRFSYLHPYSRTREAFVPASLSEEFDNELKIKAQEANRLKQQAVYEKEETYYTNLFGLINQMPPADAQARLDESLEELRQKLSVVDSTLDHHQDRLYRLYQSQEQRLLAKQRELIHKQAELAKAEAEASKYIGGFEAFMSPDKSVNANLNSVKKWITTIEKMEGRFTLTSEEVTLVARVFRQIYDRSKPREKKEWERGAIRNRVKKELGKELTDQVFGLLDID